MEAVADTAPAQARAGDWLAIAAGAVTAVGISLTLTGFAAAIGLSVMSTAPSWREGSAWLWFCSGLYLVFVALWSFGLGGYVAGRLRAPTVPDTRETEFRDGLHGVAAWGLALLLSAVLAGLVALAARPQAQPSDIVASPTAETLIPGELDRLLRDAQHPGDPTFAYHRAEAGRILLQAPTKRGVTGDDRDYLSAIVTAEVGLGQDAAMQRVDRAVAEARDAIHQARVAAVLQAFMLAAGLALGAAVAWFSAVEGGKERDRGRIPQWRWLHRKTA
jgi:hypothetical protein